MAIEKIQAIRGMSDMLPEDAVEKLTTKAESTHADLIDGGYREWCDGKAGILQK